MVNIPELSPGGIHQSLRSYTDDPIRKTCIEGFNTGIIDFVGSERHLSISKLGLASTILRGSFQDRGFNEEELDSGIWLVADYPYKYYPYPQVPLPETFSVYASLPEGLNSWKMIEPIGYRESRVIPVIQEYADRLLDVMFLSQLPFVIAERYGSYDTFVGALKQSDPNLSMGDLHAVFPNPPLYNGGLDTFVRLAGRFLTHDKGPLGSTDIMIAQNL